MNNTIKFLIIGLCTINLSSCMTYDETNHYAYEAYAYDESHFYSQDYTQFNTFSYPNQEPRVRPVVSVPDSYHVGEYHSPVASKDIDRTWVSGQNPQGYTIEVANGDKASQVAQKLYKAPKSDRMAQVKYHQNGKVYYKGLYGSYQSAEEAQKALDALPPEIKQGAGVKNWGAVQGSLND